MNKKKVSVIIPTFNRVKLLKRALHSIFYQTYNNWEIIVVDNFSSDGTERLINDLDDKRIIYKKYRNNGIIGASRNIGINSSDGYYLAFLDSDDWWDKNKLRVSIEKMESTNADLIYHNCFIKGSSFSFKTHARKLKEPIYDDLIRNGNTLITSSVVAKRQIIIDAGYFSENINISGWEDYELWIKISKIKKNFLFLPKILGNYWIGDDKFDNPERILINIKNMYDHFLKDYKEKTGVDPWWPIYTEGLAHLRNGDTNLARKKFIKNIFFDSTKLSKLKSIYYYLRSFI